MSTGKKLFAAIYATPSDAALRMVYADWLQDHGDPRGEFIISQSHAPRTTAQEQREAELIDEHGLAWQGKLGAITTWAEFELGFVARCGLERIPKTAIGWREWATVKHVGISDSYNRDIAALITHPCMKSLESVRMPTRVVEHVAATNKLTPVRSLALDGAMSPKEWQALCEARAFAGVTSLAVKGSIGGDVASSRFERIVMTAHGWQIELANKAVRVAEHRASWGGTPDRVWLRRFLKALPAGVERPDL